jgi:hypothetical protein
VASDLDGATTPVDPARDAPGDLAIDQAVAQPEVPARIDAPPPPPDVRPVLRPPPAPAPAPAGDCSDVTGVTITRVAEHLAGGWEITARLAFRDGIPPTGRELRGCASLADPQGRPVPAAVAARSLTSSATLLLVDPGRDAEEGRRSRAAVHALVARRPRTERIAVFRWAGEVAQAVAFSTDRGLLARRIEATLSPAATRAPIEQALRAVSPTLEQIDGIGADTLRAIVVVAPRRLDVPQAALAAAGPHLVLWLAPDADAPGAIAGPAGLEFSLDAQAAGAPPDAGADVDAGPTLDAGPTQDAGAIPAEPIATLSARLDQYASRAHLAFGTCGTGAAVDAAMRVVGTTSAAPLPLPASLYENLSGTCNPTAIAAGERPLPRRIDLSFTPEQRLAYDLALFTGQRTDWNVSVRLSPAHLPTPATAHLRGNGSFRCARRNYTFTLEGKAPRFLLPGSAMRSFHLVSMCLDRFYLRNFTATQLLAELGLFPSRFDLVELVLDGQSQGAYLLTEKVDAALVQRTSEASAVLRRNGNGPGVTLPEVKFAARTPDLAIAEYQGILAGTETLSGRALGDAVASRLDLDQFLTWLALMHLLGSGDYYDEIFFHATRTLSPTGAPDVFFNVSAWDNDDLFKPCHFNGRAALYDPNGILFCVEAELERRLLGDPVLYARFVDVLAATMERVSKPRVAAALTATTDRLLALWRDPATLFAMSELNAIDPTLRRNPDAVRAALLDEAAQLASRFEQQRAFLNERILEYRRDPLPLDAGLAVPRGYDAGADAASSGDPAPDAP